MKIRRPAPVTEYLKLQKRFAHLFRKDADPAVIDRIQASADRNIRRYNLIDDESLDEFVKYEGEES